MPLRTLPLHGPSGSADGRLTRHAVVAARSSRLFPVEGRSRSISEHLWIEDWKPSLRLFLSNAPLTRKAAQAFLGP